MRGLTLATGSGAGFDYLPARARNVKRALRELPIQDHSRFTFIDLGSGKGPILFLAADFPYRKIQGVELARELHLQAQANIRHFRGSRQCPEIESIYMDARDFEFPEDNLVVYFFNPFPPPTMQHVLGNLKPSLDRQPRDVFLISMFPEALAGVLDSQPWLQAVRRTRRHHIYRAFPG